MHRWLRYREASSPELIDKLKLGERMARLGVNRRNFFVEMFREKIEMMMKDATCVCFWYEEPSLIALQRKNQHE